MADDPTEYLFSPRRAMAEMMAARSAKRRTKKYPSEARKLAKKKKHHRYNDHYTTVRYGIAIGRACEKANVPHWHPNQLRHSFATLVRKMYGLDKAQVALGHAHANVTEVYADRDLVAAVDVAAQIR